MDKIYDPIDYNASEPIDTPAYFNEFANLLSSTGELQPLNQMNRDSKCEEEIFQMMNVDLDEGQRIMLERVCSVKHLEVPNELVLSKSNEMTSSHKRLYDHSVKSIPEQAESLETIRFLQTRLKKTTRVQKTDRYLQYLKYRSEVKIENTSTNTDEWNENKEIVFIIRVYLPFRYNQGQKNTVTPKFSHEIAVLGSNTVAEFCDKILCPADVGVSSDISNKLDVAVDPLVVPKAKAQYKSSLIYTNDGTLYHDDRDPNNIDYTETVLEWMKTNKEKMSSIKKVSMASVHFRDLKLRLGYPELYQHQGDCEHLFTVSDIHLLHSSEAQSLAEYPNYTATSTKLTRYCMMCGVTVARLIITNCDRLPSDPTYLCDVCFKCYLYHKDGTKIGNFRAYLYYDNSCIM